MPSHALLLRLFLSPSFFSVHVALQYLRLYSDNIGITYYLTRRLRELDTEELREVWGFICHLLVTRPSKSRALECFVGEIAQRSTHIAMLTLWFMQAALKDLSYTRHDSQSFVICQRVLHKCHEIIFGDLPPAATTPYGTINLPFQSRFARRKIRHHAEPVIIGVSVLLAGAPGMPHLTEIMGEVAIEQGRSDEEGNEYKSVEARDDQIAHGLAPSQRSQSIDGEDDFDDPEKRSEDEASPPQVDKSTVKSNGLARRRTIGAAQTVPALPLHLRTIRRSRASEDPLGQLDSEHVVTPYQSSPSVSSYRPATRAALVTADTLVAQYDIQSQIQLLRSHYCRSEVQFLLSLENISNRLLIVPRLARVSALRAELTALNHKLPAEVCMPMWCSSSDAPNIQDIPQPHHRIVRIPPSESVVLNSAERAPYLLLIEILHDDLDFAPNKRGNKEVLKKIITKEHERKGGSRDLIRFSSSTPRHQPKLSSVNVSDAIQAREQTTSKPHVVTAEAEAIATLPNDEVEIDLVEQLYGPDQSIRSRTVDLSESIVLPPALKNKELDMVTWSRSNSVSASPAIENPSSNITPLPLPPDINRIPRLSSKIGFRQGEHHSTGSDPSRVISLDEYSERMRTAAIMLAQLNANLARETSNAQTSMSSNLPDNSTSGPFSWLSGSNWLTGPPDPLNIKDRSPTNGPTDHSQPIPSRMRLQYAEASTIRDRIMKEMLCLEEERMDRMRENREGDSMMRISDVSGSLKSAEDEDIIRRELNKVDPSAVVFSESWAAKKSRIRHGSPYGHLANWDCVSVIVKTGGDLRQEQLAVQLIQEFQRIWVEENCQCWVRYFRILITGGSSGLVETITDAVSIHSIKKAEYARRLAGGRLGHVTLFDHFKSTYGDPSSAKFVRAQRNFAKSLAGYSVVTYLLQVKDRHNGNILLDRDGHLIHIDFGFILSNTPGNIGFEGAPFKLPLEYVEVLGGVDGAPFLEFKRLFREGFEASRKHCDRIITLVELMQKDSTLPCFLAFGEQTANLLRDRFQPALTHSLVGEHVDRLIESSVGSHWTRLYDSYQYYSQSIL